MNNSSFTSFYDHSCAFFCCEKSSFWSVRGRLFCLKTLLQKILFLPSMLCLKLGLTVCRVTGLFMGLALVVFTFGTSVRSREFFLRRVLYLARDFADWVFLPFQLILAGLRLFLGAFVHPAFYFRA